MEVACSTYHCGYHLDLESSFVMSNNGLFERFVYVVYVVNGVKCIVVRGVFILNEL